MGVFVDRKLEKFRGVADNPVTLLTANEHTIEIRSLVVCNRTDRPLRFNSRIGSVNGTTLKKDCYAASTTNLAANYNNGASGEGATLTNNGVNTVFTIDGTIPELNSRVLIKDQTDNTQNGIYCISDLGSIATPWILTRAFDYDSGDNISQGDIVRVVNGTLNGTTIWNQTSVVLSVGTSPITFLSVLTTFTQITNEELIKPWESKNIIKLTGVIELEYSKTPFVMDSFICNTNGYSQVFDCTVRYLVYKELPYK